MKRKIFFQIGDKKMVMEVEASTDQEAMAKLREKFKVLRIEVIGAAKRNNNFIDDDLVKMFTDIFKK